MICTSYRTSRQAGRLLPLASVLLLGAPAAHAQTQPVDPSAGLPSITASFNHTDIDTVAGTPYDFNYYDFNITGFTNVGAGNPAYGIFSFSNSTLENLPGVVGVASAYLPLGWTFNDNKDFLISTSRLVGIYPDDPQFGLIFIQALGAAPINPTGAPFAVFHQVGGMDPFVTPNKTPITVPVNAPVPEASTTLSFGLPLALGLIGLLAARRKKAF